MLSGETVRIGANRFRPFSPGFHLNIVRAAFAKSGIRTKFVYYPPARVYLHAKRGDVDGSTPWVFSKERNKHFYYSDRISSGKLVFFHLRKTKFDWKNYTDLEGLPIGLILKNFYGPAFHNALKIGRIKVQYVPRNTLNFDKLLKGRIKLFPNNKRAGYYMLRTYFPDKQKLFTHHPRALKTSHYHLLFTRKSPKSPRLLRLFNQGLKALKKSGQYRKLLKK